MDRSLLRITPSGASGLTFAGLCFVFLPMLAGSYWLSIFTSTTIFAMAISGVAFMYEGLAWSA